MVLFLVVVVVCCWVCCCCFWLLFFFLGGGENVIQSCFLTSIPLTEVKGYTLLKRNWNNFNLKKKKIIWRLPWQNWTQSGWNRRLLWSSCTEDHRLLCWPPEPGHRFSAWHQGVKYWSGGFVHVSDRLGYMRVGQLACPVSQDYQCWDFMTSPHKVAVILLCSKEWLLALWACLAFS